MASLTEAFTCMHTNTCLLRIFGTQWCNAPSRWVWLHSYLLFSHYIWKGIIMLLWWKTPGWYRVNLLVKEMMFIYLIFCFCIFSFGSLYIFTWQFKFLYVGSKGSICCKGQGLFWCSLPWLCSQAIPGGGFVLQHFCCEGT